MGVGVEAAPLLEKGCLWVGVVAMKVTEQNAALVDEVKALVASVGA